MALSLDDAQAFLPRYLTPADRAELFAELENLPRTYSYYIVFDHSDPYQGDGWSGVDFLDYQTGRRLSLNVALLTNTCDMSPDNERARPLQVTVAPIVKLSRLVELLKSAGKSGGAIEEYLRTIREQEVTNIFYLPKGAGLEEESLVFLDNLQSMPNNAFFSNRGKLRLFSLSQAGFWYFLLKLSIHFCRANEGVKRGVTPAAA